MKKIVNWIGGLVIVGVFVAAFFAYFVKSYDSATQQTFDGLGRELVESPALARAFFAREGLWPGWLWLVGDFIWFFGGIWLGSILASFKPKAE